MVRMGSYCCRQLLCQVPGTGNYGFTVNCGDTYTNCLFYSCDPCAVPGCTDINRTNYDPNATTDDETMYLPMYNTNITN